MAEIRIPTIQLRAYQEPVWRALEGGATRVYAVWHRRAGKDELGLHWTCYAAHRRRGNYLYLLPEAEHVRRAIWESINPRTGRRRLEEAFPPAICGTWRENDMVIPLACGSLVRFGGADNYDALMGGGYVGLVFSEWALADPLAWAYFKPILEENGGWALFLTTPRGENHAHTMWVKMQGQPGWVHSRLTVEETGIYTAEQLATMRQEYEALYGPDEGAALYAQELYCDWTAPMSGAFYARQLRELKLAGRIGRVPWEPKVPVETAWDLGYGDATAIWYVQRCGPEVRAIDYEEVRSKSVAELAKLVREKPYVYRAHYLPADADARRLEGQGVTVREQLEALGVTGITIGKPAPYVQQIQAVRALLTTMWLDAERCAAGLHALQHYHARYRPETKEYAPVPVHDWASHGATALAVYALAWQPAEGPPRPWREPTEAPGGLGAWMR